MSHIFICQVCWQEVERKRNQGQIVCSRHCQGILKKLNFSIERRLVENSKWEEDCLVWTGAKSENGYGRICIDYQYWPVHRYIYHVSKAAVPLDKVVMHSCDNPPCFNLQHLSIGTQLDNVIDNLKKDRHSNIKISRKEVCYIRERVANGESRKSLAREYQLSPSTVSRYCSNKLRVF